jgi:hypothetical protein
MMRREIPAPMPYERSTPARWLRTLVSTMDEAAASLCRSQWERGLLPALQPACLVRAARRLARR